MKKLLIASSALVAAAGSAAALDVTLGGEISISVSDSDLSNSLDLTPEIGASLTLTASGESMGWTYGGTIELALNTTAVAGQSLLGVSGVSAYMGGDFMGRISLADSCSDSVGGLDLFGKDDGLVGDTSGTCLNWSDFSYGGFGINAAFAMDGSDAVIVGASGAVAGQGVAIETDLNGLYDIDLALSLGGLNMNVGAVYVENETTLAAADAAVVAGLGGDGAGDFFGYGVEFDVAVAGTDVTVEFLPATKAGSFEAGMGCLTLDGTYALTGGDLIQTVGLGYECDLHDGFAVEAGIDYDVASQAATVEGGVTVSF